MRRTPPTLVLDLDGTLVDSVPDLAAALTRLMAARNLPGFAPPEVTSMVGDGVKALVERACAARDTPADAHTVAAFTADYQRNAAVLTRPYPGAETVLSLLRQNGWRIAICTNKPEVAARRLLAALGLDHYLDAIGGGDSYPTRKPDPAHLLATLEAAGGEPGAAIMVGDHANDVAAAHGAGIPCIFAGWGYGRPDMATGSAATVPALADVPAVAERLLRG